MRTPSELKAIYLELSESSEVKVLISELDKLLISRSESGSLSIPLRFIDKNSTKYAIRSSLNTNVVEVFLPETIRNFIITKLTDSGFTITHNSEPFDFYNVSWSSAIPSPYLYVQNNKTVPKLKTPKPSLIIGNPDYILTKPDIWIDFGNYIVPCYNKSTLGIL